MGGQQSYVATWQEIDAAVPLLARAAKTEHAAITRDPNGLEGKASIAFPLGLWLNVAVRAEKAPRRPPDLFVTIGRIPLPRALSYPLIELARAVLRQKGINLPPPQKTIHGLNITNGGLAARLTLPERSPLIEMLAMARGNKMDAALVSKAYCAMAHFATENPEADLAAFLRAGFKKSAAADSNQNRATLVALAMLTVSTQIGELAGAQKDKFEKCIIPRRNPTLLGRGDLAKHWALSAALAATTGGDVTAAIGTWKEVADSSPNGTGFSFIDLAADRAGIRAGEQIADPATSPAMARKLSDATDTDLLPSRALALAEGLNEQQLKQRVSHLDSARYAAAIQRIDQILDSAR